MGKIISLEAQKNQKAAKRGFREWQRRFRSLPLLDENTKWSDLPDEVILFLAEDDDEGRKIIHDLLMGTLGLGSGYEFESLPSEKLLPLLDVYFILIDQVRFECMRRLDWVQEIPLGNQPIIPLIRAYSQGSNPFLAEPPQLARQHPAYPVYSQLSEIEQRVFIRKIIPEAVQQFKEKTPGG
ncbi:MAG: hypothetical protein C0407_13180 [Desulfobacca sp.]|nr:hypothetical protein [Desulfobacca sp.]